MTTLAALLSASCGAETRGSASRVRTVMLNPVSGTVAVDEHVRVVLHAQGRPAVLGDVLIGCGTGAARAAETAVAYPGALVVAVHDGSRCWLRFGPDGTVLALETRSDPGMGQPEDVWAAVASLAHSWLVAGLPAVTFGSVPSYVVWTQLPDSSLSSRRRRRRVDSASADRERPTEV